MESVEQTIPMAVEISRAKQSSKAIYDQMMDAARITPPQGDKGRALVALDRLMRSPDHAPLSVVDEALGDLKSMARGASIPPLRTQGQGVAAKAVQELDAMVRARAAQAGPEAIKALEAGRAATKAKYAVGAIFEGLRDEPVRTIRALVAQKDTAVQQLKAIGQIAPGELPKIGRAYLDDLLSTATAEGGFSKTQRLAAEWQKLGAETKKLLFGKPEHLRDLDHFFQVARKMGESPNPSGTALTLNAGAQLGLVFRHPTLGVPMVIGSGMLSKMMHEPRVVKALTRAMGAPKQGPGRAALQQLIDASDEAGIVLATQAAQSADRSAASGSGGRR